jgi:5'-nucleotidase
MAKTKIPLLVVNDDGISAPGLIALAQELVRSDRYELKVVAPFEENSGVGFHVTLRSAVYSKRVELQGEGLSAVEAHVIWGTPVDCTKLALHGLIPGYTPALVVSGINRGANIAQVIPYSGTVSAALEATINRYPALALSLDHTASGFWNYVFAAEVGVKIINLLTEVGEFRSGMLNVNIPNIPPNEVRGVLLTSQGEAVFDEYYVEEGSDDDGRRRFRLEGTLKVPEQSEMNDALALARGFVTVTQLSTYLEVSEDKRSLGKNLIGALEGITWGRRGESVEV